MTYFNNWRKKLGLPLLMKELHEQSARSRTFILRVIYALLLFLAIGMFNVDALVGMSNARNSFGGQLGFGREVFQSIIWIQFVGIYLFLPAIVSGVLTVEKERNTLGLLLITRLNPWTIILEKFASRIVPMLTFLLISLPVMSFTYAMGGIETNILILGVWYLLLTVLQIASLAILASSFFSGTVASFLGTYLLIAIFSGGVLVLDMLFFEGTLADIGEALCRPILGWLGGPAGNHPDLNEILCYAGFFPPVLFAINGHMDDFSAMGATLAHPFLFTLFMSLPLLTSVVMNLALARLFLVRRAFIASTNPILSIFKWLDVLFVWSNNRFTRGIVLIKESQTMPELNPVAWRETAKRSLGQFRYLVRVLVLLEFPTLFFIWFDYYMLSHSQQSSPAISGWIFALWIISTLLIAVTASNLIAGERSRQTLEVLLTTPMSSRALILQKLRGVQRLMLVCAAPLISCILYQALRRTTYLMKPLNSSRYDPNIAANSATPFEYLVTALATLVIVFHVIMWLSFWVGMKMKSTSKAILSTLAAIVALCILPLILVFLTIIGIYYPHGPGGSEQWGILSWFLLSPAWLIIFAEVDKLRNLHPYPFFPVIANSFIYGWWWYRLRRRVLDHGDAGLGRSTNPRP